MVVLGGPFCHRLPPLGIQGKYEKAGPLYGRSRAIRAKVLGPEHPAVAKALNNRARFWLLLLPSCSVFYVNTEIRLYHAICCVQGKYAEADPLFVRAIEIGEKALGPDHPNVATMLSGRAGFLASQVRAARIFQEFGSWGSRSSMVVSVLGGGPLLAMQGKYAGEVEPLYQRSQATRAKMLAAENPDVAQLLKHRIRVFREFCRVFACRCAVSALGGPFRHRLPPAWYAE